MTPKQLFQFFWGWGRHKSPVHQGLSEGDILLSAIQNDKSDCSLLFFQVQAAPIAVEPPVQVCKPFQLLAIHSHHLPFLSAR